MKLLSLTLALASVVYVNLPQTTKGFECDVACDSVSDLYVNDGDCDCPDCSDEDDWTCDTCEEGCPTCGSYTECTDSTGGWTGWTFAGNGDSDEDTYFSQWEDITLNCSALWDNTSDSTCTVDGDAINNNDCDCDNCEDEKYWSCDTCANNCSSCEDNGSIFGVSIGGEECSGGDSYVNLETDCNFGLIDSLDDVVDLPIVEGSCFSFTSSWGNESVVSSGIFTCEDGAGIFTYYNNTQTCDPDASTYTEAAHLYSCGGSADACDTYTIWYDMFFLFCVGEPLGTIYANVANVGCADDVAYSVSENGIEFGYFFDGERDGTCAGQPGYVDVLGTAGCSSSFFFLSQYLTVQEGVQGSPGEDSPYVQSLSAGSRIDTVYAAVSVVAALYFA